MTDLTRERIEEIALDADMEGPILHTADELRAVCTLALEALDAREGKPVAWLAWITVATDEPMLVFASPGDDDKDDGPSFPVYTHPYPVNRDAVVEAAGELLDAVEVSDIPVKYHSFPRVVDAAANLRAVIRPFKGEANDDL